MPICPHERQVYFDQTLPCSRPGCVGHEEQAAIGIERPGGDWYDRYVVKVVFRTDGERWVPEPCVDPYVDSNLTDRMIAAGLSGAFNSL